MCAELRSLRLRASVLEQDNAELEKQCAQCDKDATATRHDLEQTQRQNATLFRDNEQLQVSFLLIFSFSG